MEKLIQKWFSIASDTPSGGNQQPWRARYQVNDEQVIIKVLLNERYKNKKSYMDLDGSAGVISLGALVSNLEIIASWDGYKLKTIETSKSTNLFDTIISLVFFKSVGLEINYKPEDLSNRKTNRFNYKRTPLPKDVRSELLKISKEYDVNLDFLKRKKIRFILNYSLVESFRWTYDPFVNELFKEITLNKELVGIPLSQLGLDPVGYLTFRFVLAKNNLFKFFKLGFIFMAPVLGVIKPLLLSGDIFYISPKKLDADDLVKAGIALNKAWLCLTKEGLSMQPICNSLIVYNSCKMNNFSRLHRVGEKLLNVNSVNFMDRPHVVVRAGFPRRNAPNCPKGPIEVERI